MKTSTRILVLGAFALAAPALASAASAQQNWNSMCRTCHGADGSANTPQGQRLKLKNYTEAAVQAELKDDEMSKVIKEGVKDANGRQAMPAYAARLSEDDIKAVIELIRSFKKE